MSDNISLEKELVNSLLSDRRRERVWRNIRFVVYACILLGYLSLFLPNLNVANDLAKEKPYVSLIRLNGEIDSTGDFSARKVVPQLNAAFRDKHAKGVILLAATHNNITIREFTPLQVKMAVVGFGRADKKQVQKMAEQQLDMSGFNLEKQNRKKDDASDALGIALCASLKSFSEQI